MILNISKYNDSETANTNLVCAKERAMNLSILGSKKVLELCVGPSLSVLEDCYSEYGIECYGNDIEKRWQEYYPSGKWIIGDALTIDVNKFDTLVFAPPLSHNCSGRREDSLSIEKINPKYLDFLESYKDFKGIKVLVLPGRTLSVRSDKDQLYKLLDKINSKFEVVPLKNKIIKYIDVYIL